MTEHQASRTLVKSPPELWAELSDQESLAGHLAEPFGEIRITRLDPETAVAWEGERASGTVRIEPSGWGTRVTLTATAPQVDPPAPETAAAPPAPETAAAPPAPAPPPPPTPPAPPPAAEARGLRTRMRGWLRSRPAEDRERPLAWPPREPAVAAEPPRCEPAAPIEAPPPAALDTPPDPDAALKRILDDLGAARHRPFSRG